MVLNFFKNCRGAEVPSQVTPSVLIRFEKCRLGTATPTESGETVPSHF